MLSDDNHMDTLDDFSRKVKEKMENHQMPPEPTVWKELLMRLPEERRKPVAYWLWIAGVAAVLIGLFFLIQPFMTDEHHGTSVQDLPFRQDKRLSESEKTEKKETDRIQAEKEKVSSSPIRRTEEPSSGENAGSSLIAKYLRDRHKNEVVIIKEEAPPAFSGKEEDTELRLSEDREKIDRDVLEKKEDIFLFIPSRKRSTGKNASLVARLGGNAGSFGGRTFGGGKDYLNDSPPWGGIPGDGLGLGSGTNHSLRPSDYSEIQHLPPVSFSVMAEIPITETWSMETGLMYTFMASRFKNPGIITYRGSLQLHYMGIPVNVKASVYQNRDWKVYVLGGGNIEKGIRSVYKQEIEYTNGTVYHANVRSGIDGFQFSVHAATGIEYRINNRIHLFGEPRIIYYFDNNQPMSARTKNPFTFGLNGGIKINF